MIIKLSVLLDEIEQAVVQAPQGVVLNEGKAASLVLELNQTRAEFVKVLEIAILIIRPSRCALQDLRVHVAFDAEKSAAEVVVKASQAIKVMERKGDLAPEHLRQGAARPIVNFMRRKLPSSRFQTVGERYRLLFPDDSDSSRH